ncbi:MAG: glycosyltransferase family 4 protein [Candidatus Eremiobacteraeota bacterium]|nr:glycosyltransferase family 4 protein [Candidatus Eremiobacteraeota bacterium]
MLEALPEAGIEAIPLRAAGYDPWRFDRRVIWDQALLPLAAARSGADLLHCTSGSLPVLSPLPTVVTVHDLAWLRTQAHTRGYARWYFGAFSARRWRTARAIVVDSHFSRDELLRTVEVDAERVAVVQPGVEADFSTLVRAPERPATLLAVGTIERRKNVGVVIEALTGLPDVDLICVGPPTPYQDECIALAQRLGVAQRVRFRGYVEREELLRLYARCTVAVAPSRYEGFGYAAGQALCAGIPLLAARSSSLVEVVGDDAPLLDPDDPAAWSAALAQALSRRVALEERAAAIRASACERFAWRRSAYALAKVYRDATTGRRPVS